MLLTSAAFTHFGNIPISYTGEGENISPPLEWHDVPMGCRSFALICEDPDAPKERMEDDNFTHWVIYGISPQVKSLPEAIATQAELKEPITALQGLNSFNSIGYRGPMPPAGSGPHRYIFTLYALDSGLSLGPGATKAALLSAMENKIIDRAVLTGRYERVPMRQVANS